MGKWRVVDSTDLDDGEQIGVVENLPAGLVHIQVDGDVTPDAAERLRAQLAAAINDAKDARP